MLDAVIAARRAVSTGHSDRPGHRRSDMWSDRCARGAEAVLTSIGFKLVIGSMDIDMSGDRQESAIGNLRKYWRV